MVSGVSGTVCQAFQMVMVVAEGTCYELGLTVAWENPFSLRRVSTPGLLSQGGSTTACVLFKRI